MARWDGHTKATTTCAECGKTFETEPARKAYGFDIYCSRACKHARFYFQKACRGCGALFATTRRQNRNYCSPQCREVKRPKDKDVAQLFWSRVKKGAGCWEWTMKLNKAGYGAMAGFARQRLTHRIAWELTYGPIPAGLNVLHRCDNRACVRPDHLFLGTHGDNVADMTSKGRQNGGDKKLTPEAVRVIRRRLENETQAAIAHDYGVHPTSIGDIARGATWKRVT